MEIGVNSSSQETLQTLKPNQLPSKTPQPVT